MSFKVLYVLTISLFMLIINIFAADAYVASKNGVKIFRNEKRELYENPIHKSRKNEYMDVIEKKSRMFKVKLPNGKVGWVSKKDIKKQSSSSGSSDYTFDDVEISGWLDNPQAVYIMDMDDPTIQPIKLEKSFMDDLIQNEDKEKMEESHGMYEAEK